MLMGGLNPQQPTQRMGVLDGGWNGIQTGAADVWMATDSEAQCLHLERTLPMNVGSIFADLVHAVCCESLVLAGSEVNGRRPSSRCPVPCTLHTTDHVSSGPSPIYKDPFSG